MRASVFVTRPIFAETMEKLRREADLRVNPNDRVLSRHELIEGLRDADGTMAFVTDTIDREVIRSIPRVKVIANFSVGVNHVDLDAATEAGIVVTNTPGVLTETTADFAWTLLMAAARRIVEADNYVRAGKFKAWGPTMFLGHDLHGKTLGIIGLGRIGKAVARRARGFDMNVVFCNPRPVAASITEELRVRQVMLDELLRTSDFITLHVPLVPETRHLLNDVTFGMMKKTCIVVNSSRGPVVDEKALARALKERRIAGAALDVFEREPEIEQELFELENVVLAPHIASASHDTRLKMCMMAADNLLAALAGERPPNLVNSDVWDRRRK